MRKNRKGQAMRTIGSIVLILIVVGLLLWLFSDKITILSRSLDECTGYCSNNCYDGGVGTLSPTGNDWCKAGYYDVRNTGYSTTKGQDPGRVLGKELGLRCCAVILTKKGIPASFLGEDRRVGELKPKEYEKIQEVITPPRIVAYFGSRDLPVNNGELMTLYSNSPYAFTFKAENVMKIEGNNPDYIIAYADKTLQKPVLHCTARVVDEDGEMVQDFTEKICKSNSFSGKTSSKGTESTEAGITISNYLPPAEYEGKILELVILLTEEAGRYDGRNPYDTRFGIKLKIENPIKISGMTAGYTREKKIRASCSGIDCTNIYFKLTKEVADCESEEWDPDHINPSKEYIEGTIVEGHHYEATYEDNDKSVGYILINDEEATGKYLCVHARTKDGKEYARSSDIPLAIDRTPPLVTGTFNPLEFYTEVTCNDAQPTSGPDNWAGCSGAYGGHYISDPVDFIGALFTGDKHPELWCPTSRNEYTFRSKSQIPYSGVQDLQVLCIRVDDRAGNAGYDIVLTYNTIDILEAVANDQLENGGYGTGYTGGFWS